MRRLRSPEPGVELVHAALIFEHAGTGRCLENAISLVSPGGHLSVVTQLSHTSAHGRAAAARVGSQQIDFTLIDPEWLRREVQARGFHLKHQETHNVPDSQFWAALFQRTER